MNKERRLFSHFIQKEKKRIKRNRDHFQQYRKAFEPELYHRLISSCLNCRECILEGPPFHVVCESEDGDGYKVNYLGACCHRYDERPVDYLRNSRVWLEVEEYEP